MTLVIILVSVGLGCLWSYLYDDHLPRRNRRRAGIEEGIRRANDKLHAPTGAESAEEK